MSWFWRSPDCDTWSKRSGKTRKRESDTLSRLDDTENRKKLKSSIPNREAQSADVAVRNESNAESYSSINHVEAFKRISFAQGHQAPEYKGRVLYDDDLYVMKRFTHHCTQCHICYNSIVLIIPRHSLSSEGLSLLLDVTQCVSSINGPLSFNIDLESDQKSRVEILDDSIAATLSSSEGLVFSSYTDYDKAIRKELRMELIKQGFDSSQVCKFLDTICSYVKKIRDHGFLGEPEDSTVEELWCNWPKEFCHPNWSEYANGQSTVSICPTARPLGSCWRRWSRNYAWEEVRMHHLNGRQYSYQSRNSSGLRNMASC